MNYMPSGTISQTSCKECIFAIYEDNTQVACEANRIEKFKKDIIEAYDNEKEFFVINRICNLYKTKDWNNGQKDLSKAKFESSITCDILINCDNIDDEMMKYIQSLLSTINKKYIIKLFHSYQISDDKKEKIKNLVYTDHNIFVSMYINKAEYIYLTLLKSASAFHTIVDETNYIGIEKFILDIDTIINEDLGRGLIFKSGSKTAISTLAFKILYPELYLDFENKYPEVEQQIKNNNLYIEF